MSRAHPLLSRRSASRPERVRPVPSVGELSAAARAASRVLAGPEAPCPRRLGSRHPRAQSCQLGSLRVCLSVCLRVESREVGTLKVRE